LTASSARVEFHPEVVMTKLLVCLLFAAAVVAANPFLVTYLNEVSVDPSHQFVELHGQPDGQPADLNGWQIVTSTSTCTLTCQLQYEEFLVIDSEALALGDIGHGALRLNPSGDSVFLLDDTGRVADSLHYPRYGAPLPPIPGSIAFWRCKYVWDDWMNWYIDSTSTPGQVNDDYCVIAGTLTGTGGVTLQEATVTVAGQYGGFGCALSNETSFSICGLGAGTYQVVARAHHDGRDYYAVYPESVTVGYSQVVGGIDIVVPLTGVAEAPSTPLLPQMRSADRALLLSGDGITPVSVQFYNQVGSRVGEFHPGPIQGEKRIELPATLAPGIYFAFARKGTSRSTVKVVLW
jgi:hypothetical protein